MAESGRAPMFYLEFFLRKSKWLIDPNSENVLPYWEFDLRAQWENVLPKKIFFYQIGKMFYEIGKKFYQRINEKI